MHEMRELPTGQIKVISYDIRMNKLNKIERVVLHEMISGDEDEVFDYMTSMGVDGLDLDYALDNFENEGHNVASFGVMGGLVSTSFEGIVQ